MLNYSAPCYTLQEAQDILSLRNSELFHEIRGGNIQAVLYTKPRKMLLFKREAVGEWTGLAVCRYRGHIECHLDFILSLLDAPSAILGASLVRLLDGAGITEWSIDYPYQRQLPHLPLTGWVPLDYSDAIDQSLALIASCENRPIGQSLPIGKLSVPLYSCYATPFPKESQPVVRQANAWLKKSLKAQILESSPLLSNSLGTLELDFFSVNARFSFDDMRIPASEIERFKAFTAEQHKTKKASLEIEKIIEHTKGRRENQFHSMLERILAQFPAIGAKDTWRVIEEDFDRDEKLFDADNIIQAIDADALEWRSRSDKLTQIKWLSFKPILSRVKNKLTGN